MSSTWKYKYFIDVVENKSFTKAGTINYVSQTAISQNISSLEKSIGGKLLNRGNGEIILTEIGEVVYKRAKEILSLEQQMLREVEHIKNKGMLLVGSSKISSIVCLNISIVHTPPAEVFIKAS